ncbi:MAG: bifunctional oligoribonuclease/PAP phosphatase NrnA [Spirochaetaceae bacterium]|nr:bifunctional oligoribonuclease/PAP phosphatase NrnA [Spirochaetaceae bacterium]
MHLITDKQAELFKDFIQNHDSFIIAGHKEPDGDCVASSLGTAAILDHFKKPYQLISAGPFKRTEIKTYEKKFAKQATLRKTGRQGLIIVDCGELKRIGDVLPATELTEGLTKLDTFIIDHHKTSSPENETFIIDPTTPATACLVLQLYEKLVGIPDKKTAEILFFGLATDTGYFHFLGTDSAEVFIAAARLVNYGVNPRLIYDKMTSGKPYSTRKLLGVMLDRAEQYFDGKLIISYETMEDTHRLGSEGRDSDSLYQLLLSSANTEAVVFIRQETEQTCTMGFRSRDAIDVSQIASVFGGGGHKNAAGCSTTGTIQELTPKILNEFKKIF